MKLVLVASLFASFVLYLCVSVTGGEPFYLAVLLCVSAVAVDGFEKHDFTAVKLFTQKAE